MSESQQRPSVNLGALGQTGLFRANGYVLDEWNTELRGSRGRRVIREARDNDPIVGGVLFGITMLTRQVGWHIAPHPEASEDDERVTFIEEARGDMAVSWEDTLTEILTFLPYGWAFLETLFKVRDGKNSKYADNKIGWHSWSLRGQESLLKWRFDDYGQPMAMVQLGPPDYLEHVIPFEKGMLFRTTSERANPEGRSVLRNALRSWRMKKIIEEIEAIGIERDLAGLPIVWLPPELLSGDGTPEDEAAREAFTEMVQNIKRNEQEGVLMPLDYDENGNKRYDLTLLSSGGARQFNTDAIIARYDARIAQTMLADWLLMGHEAVGTQSLAQTKSGLFTLALAAYCDSIKDVINSTAIPRLLALNGYSTENAPQLVHGDVERADLGLLGSYLAALAQAGFQLDTSFDGELLRHLLDKGQLPEPPKELPAYLHEPVLTSEQSTDGPPAQPQQDQQTQPAQK